MCIRDSSSPSSRRQPVGDYTSKRKFPTENPLEGFSMTAGKVSAQGIDIGNTRLLTTTDWANLTVGGHCQTWSTGQSLWVAPRCVDGSSEHGFARWVGSIGEARDISRYWSRPTQLVMRWAAAPRMHKPLLLLKFTTVVTRTRKQCTC